MRSLRFLNDKRVINVLTCQILVVFHNIATNRDFALHVELRPLSSLLIEDLKELNHI